MAAFIKRSTALKCPYHKQVLDACIDDLSTYGYFRKDFVIKRLQMEAVESAIRWDYIVGFIIEAIGEVEKLLLIPVATSYFTKTVSKRRTDEVPLQGRYLAGGAGRKTAGWVKVSNTDGRMVLRAAQIKVAQAQGKAAAVRSFCQHAIEAALAEDPESTLALDLQNINGGPQIAAPMVHQPPLI